jgi:hypothetical protein
MEERDALQSHIHPQTHVEIMVCMRVLLPVCNLPTVILGMRFFKECCVLSVALVQLL